MEIRRRAAIAVLAFLPALPVHAVPTHEVQTPTGAVPFIPSPGGAVIVPVLVDGRGPYSFLVDTGATHSVLQKAVVRELGLEVVARMAVVTPVGTESREVVRVGRLAVGPATVEGILVSVVDGGRLAMDGSRFDGILGQNFLSRFDYTIDYRGRRLVWGATEPAANDQRFVLHRNEGRFLVELPQPGEEGPPMAFVPDSGASGIVVYDRGNRIPLRSDLMPGRAELMASSGKRGLVTMRRIRRLQVGDMTLRDQVAAIVNRTQPGAPDGDGLLPLHGFASVSFSAAGGYMVIRPR
jgi:predicted aspartyl protease